MNNYYRRNITHFPNNLSAIFYKQPQTFIFKFFKKEVQSFIYILDEEIAIARLVSALFEMIWKKCFIYSNFQYYNIFRRQSQSHKMQPVCQKQKNQIVLSWETYSEKYFDKDIQPINFFQDQKPKNCPQLKWRKEELELLGNLYLTQGLTWKEIASYYKSRSYSNVKNKFNNSLKSFSKILRNQEQKIFKAAKKTITIQMLRIMIEFVDQLQRSLKKLQLVPNLESKFFNFRNYVIKTSLTIEYIQIQQSQLENTVRLFKFLNSKIRSYGIFKKNTNKKNWNIKLKSLKSIIQFDCIIKEEAISKLQILYAQENTRKIAKQKKTQKIQNIQLPVLAQSAENTIDSGSQLILSSLQYSYSGILELGLMQQSQEYPFCF